MAVAKKIQIYDTTLRDGCQSEDVSLTTADKLQIAERLDDLGIDYIEGGWPGSNARDAAFFQEVKRLKLRHAKIAAFGSTRRTYIRASADLNLQLMIVAIRRSRPSWARPGPAVREALRIRWAPISKYSTTPSRISRSTLTR
jgi:2-isopropylmalate synthase